MTRLGLILCGGRSRRMGRPKADLDLDGHPLITRVHEAVAPVVDQVVLLGDCAALPELTRRPDPIPEAGPLVALGHALPDHPADDWLICPCDMPDLRADLLARLFTSGAITAFHDPGRGTVTPLPLRLSAEMRPVVAARVRDGCRAVRDLFECVPPDLVHLAPDEARALVNLNTPDDVNRFSPWDRSSPPRA